MDSQFVGQKLKPSIHAWISGENSLLARVDSLRTCAETFSPPKPPRRVADPHATGHEIRGTAATAGENATARNSEIVP
jgi:hypothetical protein